MKTLYLRILVTTFVVMISSSLLAFLISNDYYQYKLKPRNDKKITKMALDIVDFYEKNPEVNVGNYLHNIGDLGYQIFMVDELGNETNYGGQYRKNDLDIDVIDQVLDGEIYHGVAAFPTSAFITGFFDNDINNSIGVPVKIYNQQYAVFVRPDTEVQFGELRIFFALLMVITAIISFGLITISTRYIVKPITKLTEATKKIAKGKYDIQLHVSRKDEIGVLANNFSEMAKGLSQLEEMRQEFVSNVSHEIQSPLASIKGFAQTLQTEEVTFEQRQKYLKIIENESTRMSQLSKQLLLLASLDKEDTILEKSSFDVAEQIKQIVFMTEWSWREKDLAIDLDLPSTIILGDQKLLHQVWTNILTNSIKYTDNGGSISITIREQKNQCHIEFKDTGIGISEENQSQIFNRFYKVDKARNRGGESNSSGLGLAISKEIIDLHNGQIIVESQIGKGSIFHIYLPLD